MNNLLNKIILHAKNEQLKYSNAISSLILAVCLIGFSGFKLWEIFDAESKIKESKESMEMQTIFFLTKERLERLERLEEELFKKKIIYGGLLALSIFGLVDTKKRLDRIGLRQKATKGDPNAQYNLGVRYENGQEGVDVDEIQAVSWYQKAAEQGHSLAQNSLGAMYDAGSGVTKNEAQAIEWYRKAAAQGLAEGQYNLGVKCAAEGNEVQAVDWYRKAAEQGYALAQNNLGFMYQEGKGVDKDEVQAVAWYRKAAKQGQVNAQGHLTQLGRKL